MLTLSRDEFATVSDAARLLSLSEARVRQLTAAGTLTVAVTTPHGGLFNRADVEQLARTRAAKRGESQNT